MLANESQARFIGYGAMLMESFVAIMALIAASVLEPGVYFAMNSPAGVIGTTAVEAAQKIQTWGFAVTPEMLTGLAAEIQEPSILSKAGGAPTLAVGMAQILAKIFGGSSLMAFWYHFAILFEALFILTTVDAGTRVARFMIQDLFGTFVPFMKRTQSWTANLLATSLAVGAWGYILYQGVIDPLGGINTLWPLFGIANQMLAGMALVLCTVVLFKMKRERYAWVTITPAVWLAICTLTAGWQKVFHENPAIGFLAQAHKYSAAIIDGKVLAPAKTMEQMHQVVFNNYLDAALCGLFMSVLVLLIIFGLVAIVKALSNPQASTAEVIHGTAELRAATL
jgi:carbon starvation protein